MLRTLHRVLTGLAFLVLGVSIAGAQPGYQTIDPNVKPKKREIYFYNIRAYPFGKIPQAARPSALDYATTKMQSFASQSSRSLASSGIAEWRAIGPFNVGGRVRSIAVHPTDGKTVWIGAADGGVWKSTDNGDSWIPVMDFENAISMGALAVDPNNGDILFAGTGEMSSNVDSYTGAGIFRSTDGGLTWKGSGLTNVGAFSTIRIHPLNSNLIFAGGNKNNGGLYRSEDGGRTWTRTFTTGVSDITVNPTNENELWIGTMGSGVYKSTDGGKTFTDANTGLGIDTPARTSVQCAVSDPRILYAVVHETVGTGTSQASLSRIYKSTNGGDSWAPILNNSPNFLNTPVPQGWYNNAIGVSPVNPDIVLGLGVSPVRTSNGGANWIFMNTYGGTNIHPDQHCIAFDPTDPNRVYLGNDGGVYRSTDAGASFTKTSDGLAITQFYGLGIDQLRPNTTWGGAQDNGTMNTLGQRILGGDGMLVFADHTNSDIIYAEREEGQMYRIDGGNATSLTNGLDGSETVSWVAPWIIDPVNPNILYCGRQSVYKSFDQGESWIKTSGKFKGNAISMATSRVDPRIVYAGSDRGELLVSADGGESWIDRTFAPGMPNRAITDFAPSLTDANTAYMTVSGFFTDHIFKSTDQGANWTNVGRGLPDIPFNTIAIHTGNEQILYTGSDIGMFISIDGGATWATYSNGLPRAAVVDLEVHRESNTLRAATHGRSMYEIDLETPVLDPSITSPSGGEVWMGGSAQSISWSGFNGPVRLDISLDGGTDWYPLGANMVGPVYRWNVFDTTANYAIVRATSSDGAQSATSRTFTISKFERGGALAATQVRTIPYGIAYDGEFLWATDFGSDTLLKLDPTTLQTVGLVKMNLTDADSLFTDLAWVPSRNAFFIHKLSSTTAGSRGWIYEVDRQGNQKGRWQSQATYPIGLAWLGDVDPDYSYLVATDRDNEQLIYYYDLAALDPSTTSAAPTAAFPRKRVVPLGPRGATHSPRSQTIYQVITDFTGEVLQTCIAEKLIADDNQEVLCSFPLSSPATSGFINARGIEFDPRDSNLWVSDYSGNIFKVVSCDGRPPSGPGPIGSVRADGSARNVNLDGILPNPFTGPANIRFTLDKAGYARVAVYASDGREVALLADRVFQTGHHTVGFDPQGLPSGVYRCAITLADGQMAVRTMVYIR